MERYLAQMRDRLRRDGFASRFSVMTSNGGRVDAEEAVAAPVRLIESGPVGGVIASGVVAGHAGERQILAFDMGGTTAKVCVTRVGETSIQHDFEAARVQRFKRGSGIPLRVPVIQMIEIGAGGGSVAHVDSLGLLKVGPESTGAAPGPAAYANGGELPTVTDADLLLGRISADGFLGGRLQLDPSQSVAAITRDIAEPLGMSVEEAAVGIVEVVDNNMASAARLHVTERNRDPADLTLVASGGAGPVHAYRLAELLGVKRVIFPFRAGTFSALGFLMAAERIDLVQSSYGRVSTLDWAAVDDVIKGLQADLEGRIAGRTPSDIDSYEVELVADMRMAGQGYEISVPIDREIVDGRDESALRAAFTEQYARQFGSAPRTAGDLEIITWRLGARGIQAAVELPTFPSRFAEAPAAMTARPVHFHEAGFVDTPVHIRTALAPGDQLTGPVIIEEAESTVVIGPDAAVRVDDWLNIVAELP
jgi:N-methylhydantoinase A